MLFDPDARVKAVITKEPDDLTYKSERGTKFCVSTVDSGDFTDLRLAILFVSKRLDWTY